MMSSTLKTFCIGTSLALVVGCVSKPSKKGGDKSATPQKEEVKPTYAEKINAMTVADVSGKCPKDGAWNGQEWRKVVAMANACVKAKDWRKVENIGSHLAIHFSLTPWGAYYLSLAAGQRKDYPRAIWMMELALKKAPNEGLFHYQMGRMHWEQEDDVSALKSLKLASEMNPSLTDAHWIMGQIELQRGHHAQAEQLLGKALANDSRHWPALMAMASLKSKEKDWDQAETYLSRALRVNPKDSKARQALNQVQEMQAKVQAQKQPPKVSSVRKPSGEKKKVKE